MINLPLNLVMSNGFFFKKLPRPNENKNMKFGKIFLAFLIFIILGGKILKSDETHIKINGFGSEDWEEEIQEEKQKLVYYYWQLESLKKSISPRYIRIIDIQNYLKTYKLLNKGYLFTYQGLHNKFVSLCGNLTNWECKPMVKNQYGIFYIIIDSPELDENYKPLSVFKYKYLVDGLYVLDPTNYERESDGSGSYLSIYYPESPDENKFVSVEVLNDSELEEQELRTVLFQIYLPDKENVILIGDFNNWNYGSDFLLKNQEGIFQKKLKLRPGTYYYKYIADGEPILDTYNPNVKIRYPFEYEVSELIVPEREFPVEKK